MALLAQILITGLAAGAVYGLFAVAYSLVYRLTGVVHFALGELAGAAVFFVLWLAAGTGPVTRTNVPALRYAAAIGAAAVLSVGAGLVAYLVAVRPFRGRGSSLGWIGGLVALAFVVRTLLAATFVRSGYVLPDVFPFDKIVGDGVIDLGGAGIQVRSFLGIVVGVLLAAAAAWVLAATKWGKALRSIAADETGAFLVGVPVDRALAVAFAGAGLLAMLGAMVTLPGGTITVDSAALLGLKGLVAAVLGRFLLPWGAFVAGLALGVFEALVLNVDIGPVELGAPYGDVLPLAVVLVAVAARLWRNRNAVAE
jgi:branched-chain amino acid transport system permease protein